MGKARDTREAVETALGHDRLLGAASITVGNIGGRVVLNGTVASYPQYLQAAEVTRRVSRVTHVHNRLEVVLPQADYRDDAMLTTAANNALAAATAVPEGVEATAKNGNLTLTGEARYRSQREAAESAVSGLTGVCNVKDEIAIVFDVEPTDVNWLVKEALDEHRVPADDSEVVAIARGNKVRLIGHVRTRAQRDAAVAAVWRGHAVMSVVDEIQVTG